RLVGVAGGDGTSGAADGDLVVREGDLNRPATLSGHHSRCLRSRWMSGISPIAAWIWWTSWSWSARASAQSRVSTRSWSRRGRAGTLVVVTHQAPTEGRVVVTRHVPTGVRSEEHTSELQSRE